MIPTFERLDYLGQTLKSVLEQDPGPEVMQIEVVDNCSREADVRGRIREIAGTRVGFFRQSVNVGMGMNWTTCIRRARGRFVHILHDDDMLMPGFYEAYRQVIEVHPDVQMLFCRPVVVDARGRWMHIPECAPDLKSSRILTDAARRLTIKNMMYTPGVVVRRDAYETVGGFVPGLSFGLDWEMWLRIAPLGPVAYLDKPHVIYREHPLSASSAHAAALKHLREWLYIAELAARRLSLEDRQRVRQQQARELSYTLLYWQDQLIQSGNYRAALLHLAWALRLHLHPMTVLRVLRPFLPKIFSSRDLH